MKAGSKVEDSIITKIRYDYFPALPTGDNPEGWEEREVGKLGVVYIQEHLPESEGDKLYYDIIYGNGTIERTFRPDKVYYSLINISTNEHRTEEPGSGTTTDAGPSTKSGGGEFNPGSTKGSVGEGEGGEF